MKLLAALGMTAVDEAMAVFELGSCRKKAGADDSKVVVSRAPVAGRTTSDVDYVAVESRAEVDVSVALQLPRIVGQLNPVGVSSHLGY